MERSKLLQGVVDKVLQVPVTISLNNTAYELRPVCYGSLLRISKLLLQIEENKIEEKNAIRASYKGMAAHSSQVAEALAILIQNSKEEPSNEFIEAVLWGMSDTDMLALLAIVSRQLDVSGFYERFSQPSSEEDKEEASASKRPDSPWGLIGDLMKHFRWTEEYILYGVSYPNLLMYLATIPKYDSKVKSTAQPPKSHKDDARFQSFLDALNE